jgi:hypothetical protein
VQTPDIFILQLPDVGTNHMKEADPQVPSKLKLQLFPINEATRKSLEKVMFPFASTGYLVNC